ASNSRTKASVSCDHMPDDDKFSDTNPIDHSEKAHDSAKKASSKITDDVKRSDVKKRAKNSSVMDKEYLDVVKQFLENPMHPDVKNYFPNSQSLAKFRHQVKTKGFTLKEEENGDKNVVAPCKSDVSRKLRVIPLEDFDQIILSCHEAIGHGGENATFKKVQENYFGVIRIHVRNTLKKCKVCTLKSSQTGRAPVIPIISQNVFERIQVDLIDMQRQETEGYRFILHAIDHASKFHFLWPLKGKFATDVKDALRILFSFTGLPKILQCDNGGEFSDRELGDLLSEWPSSCKIVHGRPRHPQSQGLVERGHRIVADKIASFKASFTGKGEFPWHHYLPRIMYMINTMYSTRIKCTPYECVYGQKPPNIALQSNEHNDEEEGNAEALTIQSDEDITMEPNASTTSQGFDFSELPIKRVKVANELATKEAHQKIRMAANLASLKGAKRMLKRG
ncbi:SCAN domain-containing protein 3-like, partial [Tubulanus polymorphus]|uniref:SCAN domain-containing protein 3-like n=1 Tax=Tubulanus polymorphus TaxID=672921 RepID=UPI003DA65386